MKTLKDNEKKLKQIRNLKKQEEILFKEIRILREENKNLKFIVETYKDLVKVLKEEY